MPARLPLPGGSSYAEIPNDLLEELIKGLPNDDYFFDYLVDQGSLKGWRIVCRSCQCYVWFEAGSKNANTQSSQTSASIEPFKIDWGRLPDGLEKAGIVQVVKEI